MPTDGSTNTDFKLELSSHLKHTKHEPGSINLDSCGGYGEAQHWTTMTCTSNQDMYSTRDTKIHVLNSKDKHL